MTITYRVIDTLGRETPPLDISAVLNLYDTGRIAETSLVQTIGDDRWVPFHEIFQISLTTRPSLSSGPTDGEGPDIARTPNTSSDLMRPSVDMNTDVSSKRVEGNRTNFPEGFLYAAKPWPRIWAYWADTLVFSLAGGFLIGRLSYWSGSPTPEFVSNEFALSLLLSWTLIPFLIAMSQAAFGTTLGKALFGIRVLQPDGNNPSFGQAISRSYSVLVSGLYLGIPIAYLFGANKFIRDLQKGVKPSWDLGETSAYQCHPEKNRTGMMWVVAVLGILAIGLIKELGKSR